MHDNWYDDRQRWPDAPPIGDPAASVTPPHGTPVLEPQPIAGPPTEPPAAPEPPSGGSPRNWARWTGLVAAMALVLAAFSVGFWLGDEADTVQLDLQAAAEPVTDDVPVTVDEDTAGVVPLPPPVIADEDIAEPVVAVAKAVEPAVVLLASLEGQGSGIIYDESGLILTNAHVVGDATEMEVRLASGVRTAGEVLGYDRRTDVAVVQIDDSLEFGVARLAPEASVQVGQLAVAVGSPFGLEQTVTSGVVSAMGRVVQNEVLGTETVVGMIQTDAPINPGNSGGALADREGRVIGMNTAIRTDGSQGNVGVGFAIPAETAQLIAERIINGEDLNSGYLGISGQDPTVGDPGALVLEVVAGDPAALAGLQPGDLIVTIEGQPITSMADLAAQIRLSPPGSTIAVEVVRDGESFDFDVTLGSLDDE